MIHWRLGCLLNNLGVNFDDQKLIHSVELSLLRAYTKAKKAPVYDISGLQPADMVSFKVDESFKTFDSKKFTKALAEVSSTLNYLEI